MFRSIRSKIVVKLRHILEKSADLDMMKRSAHDTLALQILAPLSTTYQPWNPSALRPSALVKILNEIMLNRRSCIVECGGGISTIYIAKVLKQQRNGHLYTLEDNLDWIEILKPLLEEQGLSEYVTIVPAPLVTCQWALDNNLWYDLSLFRSHVEAGTIDLLIVDGPPAHDRPRRFSRYPALPALRDFFAPNLTIVLDDINRSSEAEIVVKWANEFGLTFEKYLYDGDIAIARTQGGYRIG